MITLSTAQQIGTAVIRVTFDGGIPISRSGSGPHDALNPRLWSIYGPSNPNVEEVRVVGGNPYSYDLILNATLTENFWVVVAGDIQDVLGNSISGQRANFTGVNAQDFFGDLQVASNAESDLRGYFNAALDGPGWRAMIAALGYGDQLVRNTAQAAFYQSLLKTAGGDYLEKITTSYGVDRPPSVGLSDDTLRTLTSQLNANRVNRTGIEAVLEAYYGLEGTRAYATASLNEPYDVEDKTLEFYIDGQDLEIIFDQTDEFQNAATATALEVAAYINRRLTLAGLRAFAVPQTDAITGDVALRIYSGLDGFKGKLQFFGGLAWDVFQFPEEPATTQAIGTQWELLNSTSTNGIPAGRVRLIWTGTGTDPNIQLVFTGDYLNLYDSAVTSDSRGLFEILDSGEDYVEFAPVEPQIIEDDTFLQAQTRGIFFVRPKIILANAATTAAVVRPAPGHAVVQLPATSLAVDRNLTTGWYLNGSTPIDITGAVRDGTTVTVTTEAAHGLSGDDWFFFDEIMVDYSYDPGAISEVVENDDITDNFSGKSGLTDADGNLYFFGRTGSVNIFNVADETWDSTGSITLANGTPDWLNAIKLDDDTFVIAASYKDTVTATVSSSSITDFDIEFLDLNPTAVLTTTSITGGTVRDLAYDFGTWVAVGDTETDEHGEAISNTAIANSTWLLIGGSLTSVASSTDTENWATVSPSGGFSTDFGFPVRSTAYGNGVWIAVGDAGQGMRSTDATSWSSITDMDVGSENINCAAWSPDGGSDGTWIAVGSNGVGTKSTDGGVTWASITDMDFGTGEIYAVANAPASYSGEWIAVGAGGLASRSIDNGDSWSSITGYIDFGGNDIYDIAFGNGAFVAVGDQGTARYVSDSMSTTATWGSITTGFGTNYIESVVYGNKQFVFAGETAAPSSGAGGIIEFDVSTTLEMQLQNLRYGGGTWIGLGAYNSLHGTRSTDDGLTWSSITDLQVGDGYTYGEPGTYNSGLAYGSATWVLTTAYGNGSRSVDNGATWTHIPDLGVGLTHQHGCEYGNGVFITVGDSGVGARSTDFGATWTAIADLDVTDNLFDIAYDGSGRWMAVGASNAGTISVDDGVTWSSITAVSFTPGEANCVAYGNGVWMVGGDDKIYRSANNGTSWTAIDVGWSGAEIISDVSYDSTEGVWVVVGNYDDSTGLVSYSIDNGLTWVAVPSLSTSDYYANLAVDNGGGYWITGAPQTINAPLSGVRFEIETTAIGTEFYRYTPSSATATALPDPDDYMEGPGIVALDSDRFLAAGGGANTHSEVFTMSTLSWSGSAEIDASSYAPPLVKDNDGNVWAMGGTDLSDDSVIDNVWSWNKSSGNWSAETAMPSARNTDQGLLWVPKGPTGQIWVSSSNGDPTNANEIYKLNINTRTWETIEYAQSTGEVTGLPVLLSNNFVMMFPVSTVTNYYPEIFDPQSGQTTGMISGTVAIPGSANPSKTVGVAGDGLIVVPGNGVSETDHFYYRAFAPEQQVSNNGLSGMFQVGSVTSSTVFTFESPVDWYTEVASGTITPVLAEDYDISSGYLLSPFEGNNLLEANTTITSALAAGVMPNVLVVASTEDFREAGGEILIDLGGDHQAVFKYLAIVNDTQLRMAPGQIVDFDYDAGSTIIDVISAPWNPSLSVGLPTTWLTAQSAGRVEALNDLTDTVAVGLDIETLILYPSDRGLGNQGYPVFDAPKISDAVLVWGGDPIDIELAAAREGDDEL